MSKVSQDYPSPDRAPPGRPLGPVAMDDSPVRPPWNANGNGSMSSVPVFDEAFGPDGAPTRTWAGLLAASAKIGVEELALRANQADQQLRENGVNFNVFHDGTHLQRPWRLDILPMVIDGGEWSGIDQGLAQRALLLDMIVADCHGPRRLVSEGVIPAEVLYSHPGFLRPFYDLKKGQNGWITLYGAELARDPNGVWRVMADRADSPSGAAFALENRIVASRTLPLALRNDPVERLAPFFLRLQNALKRLSARQTDNPRIVILSPGANHPYYFEDVYLARYLGYALVEGADLAVRDDRVFLKTLAGLIPIHGILTRGSEKEIDPLELGGAAAHGVPGILNAIRQGHVGMANTPGSGLIESPIFMPFMDRICKYFLGGDLLLPSIPTWWCANPYHMHHIRDKIDTLVIKPAFEASGGDEILAGKLTKQQKQTLLEQIAAKPHAFVAQELIARSSVPVLRDGKPGKGHAALRAFAVAEEPGKFASMPGALVRIAPTPEPMELSISAGEISKDLWVLADGPVRPVTLLADEDEEVQLRRTSAVFPSRVADDLFWLGQSLDRADFLSRLIRALIERLMVESTTETTEIAALSKALLAQGIVPPQEQNSPSQNEFLFSAINLPRAVGEATDPRGLMATISELQRLSSLERLWISPDTWRKIHEATAAFQSAASGNWRGLYDIQTAINRLILDLAAVSGLIHDGMVRSPAWRVLDIGRRIERARGMATLLESILVAEAPGPGILKMLLEIIDCKMTYRNRYLERVRAAAVFDLLITDETCPRSIAAQLIALAEHVDVLPHDGADPLQTEEKRLAMAALHSVRMTTQSALEDKSHGAVLGLVRSIEENLKALSDQLTRKYLLHSGVPRQINSDVEIPR